MISARFPHAGQTIARRTGGIRRKAAAVVRHRHAQAVARSAATSTRTRVASACLRTLDRASCMILSSSAWGRAGEPFGGRVAGDLGGDAEAIREVGHVPLDSLAEAATLRRPQRHDRLACLGKGGFDGCLPPPLPAHAHRRRRPADPAADPASASRTTAPATSRRGSPVPGGLAPRRWRVPHPRLRAVLSSTLAARKRANVAADLDRQGGQQGERRTPPAARRRIVTSEPKAAGWMANRTWLNAASMSPTASVASVPRPLLSIRAVGEGRRRQVADGDARFPAWHQASRGADRQCRVRIGAHRRAGLRRLMRAGSTSWIRGTPQRPGRASAPPAATATRAGRRRGEPRGLIAARPATTRQGCGLAPVTTAIHSGSCPGASSE